MNGSGKRKSLELVCSEEGFSEEVTKSKGNESRHYPWTDIRGRRRVFREILSIRCHNIKPKTKRENIVARGKELFSSTKKEKICGRSGLGVIHTLFINDLLIYKLI